MKIHLLVLMTISYIGKILKSCVHNRIIVLTRCSVLAFSTGNSLTKTCWSVQPLEITHYILRNLPFYHMHIAVLAKDRLQSGLVVRFQSDNYLEEIDYDNRLFFPHRKYQIAASDFIHSDYDASSKFRSWPD